MKVSVFGQRSITDKDKVYNSFQLIIEEKLDSAYEHLTYLYGGAKGPQDIIYESIKSYVDCILFKPWTMISKKLSNLAQESGKFDPVYFFFRNIQIVDNSDLVIVFDNGEQDAEVYKVISLCEKKNIPMVKVEI